MRFFIPFLALVVLGLGALSVQADDDHKKPVAAAKDDAHPEPAPNVMQWYWDTAVWSCVVFLLLLFILTKYAWTPILEGFLGAIFEAVHKERRRWGTGHSPGGL